MVCADIYYEALDTSQELRRRLQTGEWSDLNNWHKYILWVTTPLQLKFLDSEDTLTFIKDARKGKYPVPPGQENIEPDYNDDRVHGCIS